MAGHLGQLPLVRHLAEHGSARCLGQVLWDEGPSPKPEAFNLFESGVADHQRDGGYSL
jgi:hypothetical protein